MMIYSFWCVSGFICVGFYWLVIRNDVVNRLGYLMFMVMFIIVLFDWLVV